MWTGTRFITSEKYNVKIFISFGVDYDVFKKQILGVLAEYYDPDHEESYDFEDSRGYPGTCFDLETTEEAGVNFHWLYSCNDIGVLVHEITHVAHQILTNAGIDYYASLDKHEEYAYLVQNMLNACKIAPPESHIIKK